MLLDLRYLIEVLSAAGWRWSAPHVGALLAGCGLVLPDAAPSDGTVNLTSARGLQCQVRFVGGQPVGLRFLFPIPSPPRAVPEWAERYLQLTSGSVNAAMGTSGQNQWRLGLSALSVALVSISGVEAVALSVSEHARHAA